MQLLLRSPREFVQSWFASPEVRALLVPWAFHLDFGPDVSGGALFSFVEGVSDSLNGMAIVRGGVGRLITALVTLIGRRGGTVVLNAEVRRILVRDGKAYGVRTADGRELTARRAVIANLTPTVLFGSLVPEGEVPHAFLQKVRRYRYGPGTAMLHLALDGPVPWEAGSELHDAMYVHLAPYVDDVAAAYQESLADRLPRSPLLVVGQPSVVDPTRAPDGAHALWVQVRAVPGRIQGDAGGLLDGPCRWADAREPLLERVLAKIESYAPGFSRTVRAWKLMTPEDLEGDNPNLVGGDSVAGSHHLDQSYFLRPFPGWSRYRTPIARLWMVGAGTWPGAGLNATSGHLAAEAILKRRT